VNKQVSVQLIRHATLVIQLNNLKLLIDPMLSPKGALDPVQNCGNDIRFPMVNLPVNNNELTRILSETDAVFVTHLHRDHWDIEAQKLIDKNKPVFCQPADEEKIKEQGFTNVQAIDSTIDWHGITIHRTSGKHGTGEIGQKMGIVSGFVFEHTKKVIYVAGDTIWCEEVERPLNEFSPQVTVVNTGGAKFLTGGPITMTPGDVLKVLETLPGTKLIAVHMDTVNHCFIKRKDLLEILTEKKLSSKVLIPRDGETIKIQLPF
jgi:L-ascorbate metabolism protein UlaG (beta-lactamase superfamily)